MKKSMKAKTPPAGPSSHPPVLDIKSDLPKPSNHRSERQKHAGGKGQKGSP